jgi:DhnA family fructose-bisphosphate aldolase class Ia
VGAYPIVTGCDIEYGEEGQPDDAGGVHGEANELGLVEVLWTLPGLESIPCGTQNHSLKVRIQKWHNHFGILLMMPLDKGISQGECFHSVLPRRNI